MDLTPTSEFRHRVEIQQNTPTRSASGAEVASWSRFRLLNAAIKHRGAREFFRYFQVMAELQILVVIRGPWAITEKMRVVFGIRTYDILGIETADGKPPELSREIHLLCREAPGAAV